MKGSIWPRPSERDPKTGRRKPVRGSTWTYQFGIPKPEGGRRFITRGGFRTRGDAQAALAEAISEHVNSPGGVIEPSKMRLGDYLTDEWFPTLGGLKATTRKNYEGLANTYLIPHIGGERLANLTPGRIAKLYDHLRTDGRQRPRIVTVDGKQVEDRSLAESTVHHIHVVLSAALRHAVEAGLLRISPVAQLPRKARPKVTSDQKTEMVVWTAEQANRFLAASSEHRLIGLFSLALDTGMRRGELCGLRWSDIDFKAGLISVARNRVTVGYQVDDTTPKSHKARVIDIDEHTVADLKAHRRRQNKERLAWGELWQDHGLVFTREDGTPVHPQSLVRILKRLARQCEVPEITVHDLRHTHATLGLAAGVPAKVMQERLGHSSVEITLDLYSHTVPGMQAAAARMISNLIRDAK